MKRLLRKITWDDAAQIINTDALYRNQPDLKIRKTVLEYLLATLVIKRTLGEGWWQAAEDEVASQMAGGRRGSPNTHPLTPFLVALRRKFYDPTLAGQVTNLAIDLLTLINLPEANESLEQKVPELRSKRGQAFHDAWFEIRMASTFIHKGMSAKLIQASPNEKRPDIEVNCPDGRVFVECKTRKRLDPEDRSSPAEYRKKMKVRLSGVADLINNASAQVHSLGSPTLIAVDIDILDNAVGSAELKQLVSMMEHYEIRNPHVNGIILVIERVATSPASANQINLVVSWDQELHLQYNVTNPALPNPTEFFRILMDPKTTTVPTTLFLTHYAKTH